jgi:hypothetical protein
MKHNDAESPPFAARLPLTMCLAALAVAFTLSQPPPAYADDAKRPPLPPNIPEILKVPAGNKAFREGDAIGTQDYICLPAGWTFFGPQATLFNEHDEQIITHFLSPNPFEQAPNPFENGLPRATWQDSEDTSKVWATRLPPSPSTRVRFPGSCCRWLAQDGPTGGDELSETTFIQRLNTVGGLAPTTACTVGAMALVPYTADYFFYKAVKRISSK